MNNSKSKNGQIGFVLTSVLILGAVGAILVGGLVNWAVGGINQSQDNLQDEAAFKIAEAGIEYYRWHLAHDPLDFQDGTGTTGPYVHPYYDKLDTQIGQFSLDITPPATGTSIVTVKSTGNTLKEPSILRSIQTKLAIPSLAKYSVAANADIRFGSGTEVFGPLHSNGGIRFDGLAHNVVSSSKISYDDPDHSGCDEWGVHTHVTTSDPCYSTPWNNRTDIFEAGRTVGVPAVDFSGFTNDIADMKTTAQADGSYHGPSNKFGWNVVLRTDDTYDLYKVTRLKNPPSGCYDYLSQSGWGSWSIRRETFVSNNPFPPNGVIFLEDDVWVEGQIDGARVTIAAARFPETPATYANITFEEGILYTNYDGTDVIALIAQNNINAGMRSNDVIDIEAALVAQNGRVGRYYYGDGSGSPDCTPHDSKTTINLFGMIATNQRYGFAYTDDTGYTNRNIVYDGNMLYAPPPSFPLTGDQYEVISWGEVAN